MRRFRLGSTATAVVLFVLALAMGVASLPLAGLAGRAAGSTPRQRCRRGAADPGTGRSRPAGGPASAGNPIGWLLLGSGVCFALDGDAFSLLPPQPGASGGGFSHMFAGPSTRSSSCPASVSPDGTCRTSPRNSCIPITGTSASRSARQTATTRSLRPTAPARRAPVLLRPDRPGRTKEPATRSASSTRAPCSTRSPHGPLIHKAFQRRGHRRRAHRPHLHLAAGHGHRLPARTQLKQSHRLRRPQWPSSSSPARPLIQSAHSAWSHRYAPG